MFAVVRTGGKQYRVAAGDKIAVEKLAGEAGETITLGDVLLAGDGGEIKDAKGVVVSAEIIAQAKSEKVIVFKKRRRHNYRRKNGHRQQMTLLRILAVGGAAHPTKHSRTLLRHAHAPSIPCPAAGCSQPCPCRLCQRCGALSHARTACCGVSPAAPAPSCSGAAAISRCAGQA